MTDTAEKLPGIERIQQRFLSLLEERQTNIAHHVLAAWDGTDLSETANHLEAAQGILHQISGSAGSLGFHDLGQAARDGENAIIAHLADASSELIEVMKLIENFVGLGQALLDGR
ncbi:MAG: Hpt domain-containing protein [Sulfitobacter sp.]